MNRAARRAGRLLLLPLLAGGAQARAASIDLDPPAAPQVEIRASGRDAAGRDAEGDGARGNPLWSVPLESLAATRERPLFTPSRQPPPPAADTAPPAPPVAAPAPAAPARPPLALIGTVVGAAGSFGIFTDQGTGTVVRLRIGDAHQGWTLRSVSLRDVVMNAGANTVVLTLPARENGGPTPVPPRGAEGAFAAAQPGAGKPTAQRIVAPRRPPPAPADLESSH